jgi:hypothetical protein
MNDDSPLLYNVYDPFDSEYWHQPYIHQDWSPYANKFVYFPCNTCLNLNVNQLIKDMITCDKGLKPINDKCEFYVKYTETKVL